MSGVARPALLPELLPPLSTPDLARPAQLSEQSRASLIEQHPQTIALAGSDETDATFAALFGHPSADALFTPLVLPERSQPHQLGSVEPLRSELKRLVRGRLQLSSDPAEDAVDMAADEHQTIEWLSDRIRVMRVRGFTAATFERLADEMLALAQAT
jgi:hypothetical protein